VFRRQQKGAKGEGNKGIPIGQGSRCKGGKSTRRRKVQQEKGTDYLKGGTTPTAGVHRVGQSKKSPGSENEGKTLRREGKTERIPGVGVGDEVGNKTEESSFEKPPALSHSGLAGFNIYE